MKYAYFFNQKAPILFLFIFAFYGAFEWATLFPFYPLADFAGDMLTANRIRDEGYLLIGHWSTWGFNHPGPFWLYYNHFIELILSPFHLNRLQIWRLGASFISAIFILYSALSLSKFYLKKIDFIYSFIFIFLFCHFIDQVGNLWMPWRIVSAYLAFFISLLLLQQGNLNYLFPSTFLTCILIHGYASMPFFTLPFLILALIIGVRKEKDLKKYSTIFIISFFTAILFASPIFIDHYLNTPSNLTQMFMVNAAMQSKPHPELYPIIYELFYRLTHKNISSDPVQSDYTFLLALLILCILFLSRNKEEKFANSLKDFKSHFMPLFLLCISIYFTSIFYTWRFTFAPGFAPFLIYSLYYLNIFPPILLMSVLTPFYFLCNGKIKLKYCWLILSIISIAVIHLQNGLPSVRTNHQVQIISNQIEKIAKNHSISIHLDYLPSAYVHQNLIYSILFNSQPSSSKNVGQSKYEF